MARSRLHELSAHGVSVWVDSLSREMLETGHLARLIEEDAVVGVTSNPTIFEKALSTGDWYDEQLRAELERADDTKEVFFALAVEDIKRACDLLRPVWERTDGVDGFVSIEVDPDLAYERDETFEQAKRLHELVDRPNLYVKIPATVPGARRDRGLDRGGSLDQRHAHLLARPARGRRRGVRARPRAARRRRRRSDERRLRRELLRLTCRHRSRPPPRGDRAEGSRRAGSAIDNAKLAYQHYLEVFSGERWDALAAAGARPQRCLWASTSTKNPAYRDVLYVEELIGPDTVNTMPFETIEAFQDHGVVRDTLTEGVDEARALLRGARRRRDRLRGRDRDARVRGRPEVLGLVRVAARRAST